MSSALLPPGSTGMEAAFADAAEAALGLEVPIRDLWDPRTCPVEFLPWLAWTLSVDTWEETWPETFKRQAVAESLAIHRIKGSPGAIRRALTALGFGDAVVTEGVGGPRYDGSILYDGAQSYGQPAHWATYQVWINRPISPEQATQIVAVLDLIAPARCELAALNYEQAVALYDGEQTYDGTINYGTV